MARGRAVRQTEIQRALTGVRKAGQQAERIDVRPDGGFIIHLKGDTAAPDAAKKAFDNWKAKKNARAPEGPQ